MYSIFQPQDISSAQPTGDHPSPKGQPIGKPTGVAGNGHTLPGVIIGLANNKSKTICPGAAWEKSDKEKIRQTKASLSRKKKISELKPDSHCHYPQKW